MAERVFTVVTKVPVTDEHARQLGESVVNRYPEIDGYQYEILGEYKVNLLFWGAIE